MIGDDQYVSTESEFERFVNKDVLGPIGEAYEGLREKEHEDPYQGYDLLDIDDFSLNTNDRDNEDIFDSHVGAEILLPNQDGNKKMAKVIKWVKGNDGNPVGTGHNKPTLDTSNIGLLCRVLTWLPSLHLTHLITFAIFLFPSWSLNRILAPRY